MPAKVILALHYGANKRTTNGVHTNTFYDDYWLLAYSSIYGEACSCTTYIMVKIKKKTVLELGKSTEKIRKLEILEKYFITKREKHSLLWIAFTGEEMRKLKIPPLTLWKL